MIAIKNKLFQQISFYDKDGKLNTISPRERKILDINKADVTQSLKDLEKADFVSIKQI